MKHKIHCSHNRLTITNFKMNEKDKKLHSLKGVKAYGKNWGQILFIFGYSTVITSGAKKIYVNSNSLFKNMFSTWVYLNQKLDFNQKNKFINNNTRLVFSLNRLNHTSRKTNGCLTTEKLQTIFLCFNNLLYLKDVFK